MCLLHPAYALSSLNRNVVHRLVSCIPLSREQSPLSIRESKSYRFTNVVRAFALSATVDSSGDSSSHIYHDSNDDQIKFAQSRNCFHSFLIAFILSDDSDELFNVMDESSLREL